MKNLIPLYFLLATSLWISGCASGPYARQGATIGALVGTPVGALIGSRNGESGAGALIGGTFGALAGSNLGSEIDAQQEAIRHQQMPQRYGLAVQDIMTMSRSGLGEDVIITQVRNQGLNRPLGTNDLIALKQSGVSDRIIQAMQSSVLPATQPSGIPIRSAAPVIVEEHYWGPPAYQAPCDLYSHGHYRHHRPVRSGRRSSLTFSHRF